MRMSRRMVLYQSGQKVTYYDYVGVRYSNNNPNKEGSIGIKTNVTAKDVLIQTKWLPVCAEGNANTMYKIARRAYLNTYSNYGLYGAGITPYRYSSSSNRGILSIKTTDSTEIEFGVSAWARNDEWMDTEIKMSLNPINSVDNYIKVGAHQVSLGASSSATDDSGSWFLFGLNGKSDYWTDWSTEDPSGAGQLQETKFYDFSGSNLIADLLPCVRNGIVGMIDSVSGTFCPFMKDETPLDVNSSDITFGNLS